eukprot:363183_1
MDCDSDNNCIGNLKCHQRNGNAANPPGCQGAAKYDQGDCDSDSNCVGHLKCYQRVGAAPNPPGCQGTPKNDWDYCYDPARAFVDDVNVDGDNLVECQGDC